ncbi:MAG TPA: ABC transporter ATP-binding protein [Bacteroidales bacterium]|nr:ABC transporter ATP-binding protein [Bacteroidales bacterium]
MDHPDYVVKLNNVSVSYMQNRKGVHSIKDFFVKAAFLSPFQKRRVLHHIDFEIYKGDSIGVLGPNGSGKSTLLRTIAGILKPDDGWVHSRIPISPLLTLGAGIELELTGYENIRLTMALTGNYDKSARNELIGKVADFAELTDEQLRMPAKMYSSGMLARLAFSSVMTSQPELLMIDEVLAVGDKGFQKKCMDRIHEILDHGATLLFISHSPGEVKELCKRGLCLKDGRMIYSGSSEGAVDAYEDLFSTKV